MLEITVNGESRRVEPSTTIATLLQQLGFEPRYVAVEVNRELVPRRRHAERVIEERDELEIVTLVGGG